MPIGIYLAGAMRFTPDEEQYDRGWRDIVTRELYLEGVKDITIFDPMKQHSNRAGEVRLFDRWSPAALCTLQRDMEYITRSDVVFMNLIPFGVSDQAYALNVPSITSLGTPTKSGTRLIEGKMAGGYPYIGSLAEVGIAIAQHKLLVVVAHNPSVLNHPFITAGATRVLTNLEDGIEYLRGLVETLQGKETHN